MICSGQGSCGRTKWSDLARDLVAELNDLLWPGILCQNHKNGGMWNNLKIFSVQTDNIGQVSIEVRIWTCISELSGSNMGRETNRNRQCLLYHMTDVFDTVCYVTTEIFKPFILLPTAARFSASWSWSFTSYIFPRKSWSTVNTDTPSPQYARVAF